jgi:hypothetical protein
VPKYRFHMGSEIVSTNVGWACGKRETKVMPSVLG